MVLEDKDKYDRVSKILEESDLDAMFVKLPENVLYFSNWWPITGWGAALVFADRDPVLFTPDTESIFAKDRIISDMRVYVPNGNVSLIEELQKLDCAEETLKVGVEKSFEAVACTHLGYELSVPNEPFFKMLQSKIPKWDLVDGVSTITQMRAKKTAFEFERLKFVNEINNFGLEVAAEALKEEKNEMEIATLCESAINNKVNDLSEEIQFVRAFSFVMGGPENGARACWPYNISSGYHMKKGELCMMELNTQVNGYWSDITRTWVVGRNPTDEQKDMMDTINTAIKKAMKACKPGTLTRDVDKASRDYIMSTKWGEFHTPFLGHGIGVKLHEPIPMLTPESPGTVEQGHYFTIEPGLYGRKIMGALRIERDVWLGPDGPVATDTFPCEL